MTRRLFVAILLPLVLCMVVSCHGQKPDNRPSTDRRGDRIYELATHVSGQVDAVIAVQNIEGFLGHLEEAGGFDLVGVDAPPEAVGRIIAGSVGFDPQAPRGWRSKGIRTDAPLMIAFSGDDPALLLPLADPDLFEAYMNGRASAYDKSPHPRRLYGRNSSSRSDDEGDARGYPIWSVRDGVACVSLRGRRRDVDMNCVHDRTFDSRSIATSDGFLTFRDGPMRDADIGFFAPTYNKVTVEELVRGLSRKDVFAVDALIRGLARVDGFSIIGRVEDKVLHTEASLGLTPGGYEALGRFFGGTSTLEMDGVVPPDAVAGVRFEIDPATAWSWFLDTLHWTARMEFERNLEQVRERFDVELEIEQDFIQQLSGGLVLVVQPVPDPPAQPVGGTGSARQNPSRNYYPHAMVDDGLAYSWLIPFDDPVAPPRLLDKLRKISEAGSAGRQITTRQHETSTGRSISIAEFGSQYLPRIFVDRKRVLIAPSVLPVADAEKILTGAHPSASSTPARRFVNSGGPAAGFFDFQAFFESLAPSEKLEDMGDLPDRLEFAAGAMRLDQRALVAEADVVDTSFARIFVTGVFGSTVRRWSHTPSSRLRRMARRARSYYGRYQRACSNPESCPEPWHAEVGSRVDRERRVFPGGLDQRLVTHQAPPVGGRVAAYDLEAREHLEKTAAILRLESGDSGRFQYIYETNGIAGPGASFTITALADLDPTSPEKHTFEVTGTVGQNGRVDISAVEERHRFE